MSFLLAVLAQAGPLVTPGAAPPLPSQTELPARRTPRQAEAASPATPPTRLQQCLAMAENSPAAAIEAAEEWLAKEQGSARAAPGQCLGVAHSRLEHWDEAESTLIAARDVTAASDHELRARLGGMAGAAALAAGRAGPALALLDLAHGEALSAGELGMAGAIAIDRARALVALSRAAEAEAALAEARSARSGDAEAWLLSATLARRLGKLGEAQTHIERAADLKPIDPEIGLEAGVIAVLAGRDEAARKSWQSVIDAAPRSDAAETARGYIAQLGPAPALAPKP